MKRLLFLTTIIIVPLLAISQDDDHMYLLKESLQDWAVTSLKEQYSKYTIADYINPFYLEGDFNDDDKMDVVVLVEDNASHKKGFIILHSDTDPSVVIGAGVKFSNGNDDFSWMNVWKVYREDKCSPGIGEKKEVFLTGDGIWAKKSESASGLIFWTGKSYKWSQQSD